MCGEAAVGERRHATPVAMVLHLDEEEGEDEEGEEGEDEDEGEEEEEEGSGDDESDDDEDQDAAAVAPDDDDTAAADDDDDDEAGEGQHHGGEEVRIDTQGRIAGVSDCGLDFRFRSFPTAVCPPAAAPASPKPSKNKKTKTTTAASSSSSSPSSSWSRDTLIADCQAAFVGESFWLDAATEPRCALESLARAVFRQHTEHAAAAAAHDREREREGPSSSSFSLFDPLKSGAEWWVQLRHANDGQSEAVSFHWDKDEDLVDDYGWAQ